VKRGKKGKGLGRPEEWAPGRSLYSVTEVHLTEEHISEVVPLLGILNNEIPENLTDAIQSIARSYWEQHRDAQRPPADWYRTKVGRIQKAAEDLLMQLREPLGTARGLLEYRTEQRMGLRLRGSHAQEPHSIEQLLDDFVAVCKSCEFPSARGAPEKLHIKTAVASLRGVWIEFTSKAFPLNLNTADNRKDRDGRPASEQVRDDVFTSPGPRFVQIMMRIIDPEVDDGAIRTALRDASVNPRGVD
jgi:hypothetical protein